MKTSLTRENLAAKLWVSMGTLKNRERVGRSPIADFREPFVH